MFDRVKAPARLLLPMIALTAFILTSCSEMDDPIAPAGQPMPASGTIEMDPGRVVEYTVDASLNKAFSTQSYCPLNGLRIAYDMSHNSGRQNLTSPTGGNLNSVIFGDYIARGATISVISTFDLNTLSEFDVLWLEEDFFNPLTAAEQVVLQTFVANGGAVVILAEDWAGASPFLAFGYNYTPAAGSGTTSNLASHPLTAGVSTLRFESTIRGLTEPTGATWIAKNTAGTGTFISVLEYGQGKVLAMTDEFLINSNVNNEDNRIFGNNIMTWLWTKTVTIDIKPGAYPNSINCISGGNAVIPVAILSTSSFDALSVDHTTVRFEGASHTHFSRGQMTRHEEDVNGDGLLDLVFHFRRNQTTLSCNSTTGTLTGMTYCGQAIKGMDTVNMVP
jgi:hypothetical protein